ncbi:MAG: hypothetical protein IJU54_02315 [Alphaproteobacteria bacterium]|nr:hypothetical protein [Alphaproteobacteria bacterium]
MYIDGNQFTVNGADLNNYSIFECFNNRVFDVGNHDTDYLERMRKLANDIVHLNNSIDTQQHKQELNDMFKQVWNSIFVAAYAYCTAKNKDMADRLFFFYLHYDLLIDRKNNNKQELWQNITEIFGKILHNKYHNDAFEALYQKYMKQSEKYHNNFRIGYDKMKNGRMYSNK